MLQLAPLPLLLLALLGGCRTRLLDEPDAGVDLAVCASHHYLDVVPLLGLDLVDARDSIPYNRTVRVKATFPVHPGCDLPGALVEDQRPDGTITLTAHVWRAPDWTRCAPARPVERIVVLSNDIGPTSCYPAGTGVVDGAAGGTASLGVRRPCEDFRCAPLPGGGCTSNCDCDYDRWQRCIPTAPDRGACAKPCSVDTDCRSPTGTGTLNACTGAIAFTCGDAPGCAADGDCPFGQRCVTPLGATTRACRPAQTATRDAPCRCDADCAFGGLCSVTVDLGYCVLPCATANDCPDFEDCRDSQCFVPGT